MAVQIASTSFKSGPDNKAVPVDVYKKPPLKPTNNLPKNTDSSILDRMGIGGAFGINQQYLNAAMGVAKRYAETGKIIPSRDDVIKGIGNMLGVPNGTVGQIGGTVMDNLLKANGFYGSGIGNYVDSLSQIVTGHSFQDSLKSGFADVKLVVDGVNQDIKYLSELDFSNMSDLSRAIANFSGDSDFVRLLNLTDAAGMIKSMNDMAVSLYIPGVADRLMKDLKPEDRKLVTGMFNSSLSTINDLSTVDVLIKNLTPEEILNTNPNIIKLIVGGFNPTAEFPMPSKDAADALKTRLNTITEHWDGVRISEGFYRNDLEIFKNFSPFARDSFINAGYNLPELAIAGSYAPRAFTATAKETYPSIGFSA